MSWSIFFPFSFPLFLCKAQTLVLNKPSRQRLTWYSSPIHSRSADVKMDYIKVIKSKASFEINSTLKTSAAAFSLQSAPPGNERTAAEGLPPPFRREIRTKSNAEQWPPPASKCQVFVLMVVQSVCHSLRFVKVHFVVFGAGLAWQASSSSHTSAATLGTWTGMFPIRLLSKRLISDTLEHSTGSSCPQSSF